MTPEPTTDAHDDAEHGSVAKPSKIAITKMLAEAEVARRRALKPWLLALLLPMVVGAALISYTAVRVRLARIEELDRVEREKKAAIEELDRKIAEKNKELASATTSRQGYERILKDVLPDVPSSEKKQEVVNLLKSNPNLTEPTVFAVLGSYKNFDNAIRNAKNLSEQNLPYPVEVYRNSDSTLFYVTLGGHLTYAEAKERTDYAREAEISRDAYASVLAAGDRLYP